MVERNGDNRAEHAKNSTVTSKIIIAVDAMGGDFAPREIVFGAVEAARDFGIAIQLIGPPDIVEKELQRHKIAGLDISIIPASEVVAMDEKPSRAVVKKKDSSIIVTTRQVSSGAADGMVAAGSTGAAAVAAQLELGRIANVSRSAIACSMPTATEYPALLIDVGANAECDSNQLVQFAQMGSLVYTALYHVERPRVGILNLGSEETKGTDLVRETYKLLQNRAGLNFIGFVEGRDFPMGKVDVVVTDGFVGNVALKTAEGIARMIKLMLKQELMSSWLGKLGGLLAKGNIDKVEKRINYAQYGGALLVGVKGVCVIAHGGSTHTAIKNAVRVAADMAKDKIVDKIEQTFSLASAGSKAP